MVTKQEIRPRFLCPSYLMLYLFRAQITAPTSSYRNVCDNPLVHFWFPVSEHWHVQTYSGSAKVGSIWKHSIVLLAHNRVQQLDFTTLSNKRCQAELSIGEGDQLFTRAKFKLKLQANTQLSSNSRFSPHPIPTHVRQLFLAQKAIIGFLRFV